MRFPRIAKMVEGGTLGLSALGHVHVLNNVILQIELSR